MEDVPNESEAIKNEKVAKVAKEVLPIQSGNWTSHSGETRNLSILNPEGGSLSLDHVKEPLTRGISISPYSKLKFENSTTAGQNRPAPDLSL